MATSFDAFISYRRSDGNTFARRLRRILQDFRPPRPLQARQSRPLKVYLDTIYEQATNDFFERVTLPALLDSRHLIVVATKDAVDRGPDRNDWIRREIEAFERGPNAGNIFAVRAADVPAGALPGDLERRYPNIEIIDLAGLGPLSFLNPAKAARLSDETVKLLAPLLGFGLDDMPALRREEERRQQTKLGLAAGSATSLVVAVAGLALFAFDSRNRALDALSRSLFATDRVIQSVSASLPEGEARSNLLASSCDLLDSLSDRATAPPRTNALVLCAVERAESRDRLGERDMALETIDSAIKLAQRQFAKTTSPDDALAELVARKSALLRAIAGSPVGNERKTLSEFVTRSRDLTKALSAEKDLPEFAARTLQTAAVSLAQKQMTREAVDATDAAIEAGQTALDRGADLSAGLDHVAAIALKSQIHRMRGEAEASLEAAARAKTQFDTIKLQDAEAKGLGERFREVSNLVGRPSETRP
jgi:tetratricopeptide (TPR) repeat protein